jgi:hypothetical protein
MLLLRENFDLLYYMQCHTRYELSEHMKSVRNLYQLVEKAVEFYDLGCESHYV